MQTMTPDRPLDLNATVVGPGASPGPVSLREQVNARLCGAEARESVARSLTRVVEDAFLPGSCSSTRHLRDALDEPIAAATETAITTLVDELADLLDLLPETAADAWSRARLEADLGYE
jgi:hypothetical protein